MAIFFYSIHSFKNVKILTSICKEKIVILQSTEIMVIKCEETKVVTYTCRYSSGNLINNSS